MCHQHIRAPADLSSVSFSHPPHQPVLLCPIATGQSLSFQGFLQRTRKHERPAGRWLASPQFFSLEKALVTGDFWGHGTVSKLGSPLFGISVSPNSLGVECSGVFSRPGGGEGRRHELQPQICLPFFLLLTCGETLSPFLVATAWVVRIATLQVETAHSAA